MTGQSTEADEPDTTPDIPDAAADAPPDESDATQDADTEDAAGSGTRTRAGRLARVTTFMVLPIMVLVVAGGAGYAKYLQVRHHTLGDARAESVAAATDLTVSMLSYTPDNAAVTLGAAREQMTGSLRDSYTSLTTDVVIPGAQQKHISAAATVAGAASVSATDTHAVVLVFVNQSITQGQDPPTGTASAVRVTLDKHGTRWLASGFDPI